MTNPIIDALAWYPDNPARSARELQQALMDLQAEWATKLPQLGQISDPNLVSEADWIGLALKEGLDASRVDNTYLHFDNTTPAFFQEWANIYDEIQSVQSLSDTGRSEFIATPFTFIRQPPFGGQPALINQSFTLTRPAKVIFYLPLMATINDGGLSGVTIDAMVAVSIDSTLSPGTNYITTPLTMATTNPAPYDPQFLVGCSDVLAAGAHTYQVTVGHGSGTNPTSKHTAIAPLPNLDLDQSQPAYAPVLPTMAFLEIVYQ